MTDPTWPELICSECAAALPTLKGDALRCRNCETEYAVRGGIPRFVAAEHLESFGLQWNRYEVAHDDEDRATFVAKTGVSLKELKGLQVLDAGCGGGRYSKVAGEAGAFVTGVDHTTAIDKAASLCRNLDNVRFLQADLKRLPFAEASFDFAFSIGVMHHDENTRAVFDAVAKMVKPGGRMAVWLYRRNQWWQEAINNLLRRRTTKMDPQRLERWCRFGAWLGGLPVVNRTLNKLVNFSAHPDRENRICDTFDWYAPQYQ
ncbi:MAG: class I SAM-dependent methyltransferase, partial [Planctomycetaceae bacterium]